jgi:hypothetical protein
MARCTDSGHAELRRSVAALRGVRSSRRLEVGAGCGFDSLSLHARGEQSSRASVSQRRLHTSAARFAASAVASLRRIYIDYVEPPARLTISTCAGCGAMREFESCVGVCSERKLELVSGGEYDELTVAAAARRARIQAFGTVVEELVTTEPGRSDWRVAYEALRQSARSVLRRFGAASRGGADDSLSPAESVIVWRCPECGGVDAPQPCIGVCIWRPADWVDANVYESERSQAVHGLEVEKALVGLLSRVAFVTPRHGQWERNWLAVQAQARLLSRSGCSRHDPTDGAIGQAPADG